MTASAASVDALVERLARARDERERRALLRRHAATAGAALVRRLADETTRRARIDLREAESLARAASRIADDLQDSYCRGRAMRAAAHVLMVRGQHRGALATYESARATFARAGDELETAITENSALQPLIYLGCYRRAARWAAHARHVFERRRDRVRLARLDTNTANILVRQDRFREALVLYERACSVFRRLQRTRDLAFALLNMAVCQMSLHAFDDALRTYRRARAYCLRHGLPLLAAVVDYNVANLHYLRGEYFQRLADVFVTVWRRSAGRFLRHGGFEEAGRAFSVSPLNRTEERDRAFIWSVERREKTWMARHRCGGNLGIRIGADVPRDCAGATTPDRRAGIP